MNRIRFSLLLPLLLIAVDGYESAAVHRYTAASKLANVILKCICRDPPNPVCGSDNKTYNSECDLKCQTNVQQASKGPCPSTTPGHYTCDCKDKDVQYDPVCAGDEKTYNNQCEAYCAKTSVAHKGTCAPTSTTSTTSME